MIDRQVRSVILYLPSTIFYNTWIGRFYDRYEIQLVVFFVLQSLLRDNIDVLSSLGEVHFLNGDYNNATQVLQRVSYTTRKVK